MERAPAVHVLAGLPLGLDADASLHGQRVRLRVALALGRVEPHLPGARERGKRRRGREVRMKRSYRRERGRKRERDERQHRKRGRVRERTREKEATVHGGKRGRGEGEKQGGWERAREGVCEGEKEGERGKACARDVREGKCGREKKCTGMPILAIISISIFAAAVSGSSSGLT
eukprot:972558-Rhodomonas_salina.1